MYIYIHTHARARAHKHTHTYMQWQASYSCTGCNSTCGQLYGATGTLSDGSGSANYSSNANCVWMIVSSNASSLVTLRFNNFSTQPLKDVVRVFQCSNTYCSQQQLLAELSGTYADVQSITSTTGYMRVTFTTDGSVNLGGFNASWTMVCMLACTTP